MKTKPCALLFEAMYHGKYDFQDFIQSDISNYFDVIYVKDRKIQKPNRKLKAYHSFLNLFLFEYLRTNERVVFSYRKGVNAYDAVSAHANNKHFYQTDISDFFSSIDSQLIKETIIASAELSPIEDLNEHLERVLSLVTVDGRLPMGFSTSPLISNACLYKFDAALEEYSISRHLTYTRYADDLIISSKNREDLEGIQEKISELLLKTFNGRLSLNHSKSKLTHTGRKVKILGMVILPTGKVSVDIKFKNKVEVLLHFYMKDREKFLDKVDGDMRGGMEKISGYLNYINTVDKSYLDKLRKKFGGTIVDMFLHLPTKKP
ncbi:reverse transcriptase domain-containing protein [Atopomonas hussainii]|uniref:reverse transcriptase domain-containing protein n=1 Tax=Atopomonas hussainii TaxID=1429083 RepID=UPI0009002572|nr:reverse transcriptase domain-containing protein [Atopomonas hussainii]